MSRSEYHTPPGTRHELPPSIPLELRQFDQWVNHDEAKRPINARTGRLASPTDPTTWCNYDAAAMQSPFLGFVLTEYDPYFLIDLDKCRDPETGEVETWALAIVEWFNTYTEASLSGTGLHIIGRGFVSSAGNRKGRIEFYQVGRYVALTGNVLAGYERIRSCQPELTKWHGETWAAETPHQRPESAREPIIIGDTPSDQDVLERALNSRKHGSLIARLWSGDTSDYEQSQRDSGFSSQADLAFVRLVGFYTRDDEQLTDLWRQSGLYRKKLDRDDYIQRTIKQARSQMVEFYDWNRREHRHIVDGVDQESGEIVGAPLHAAADDPTIDAMSCDEVRARLKAAETQIAQLEAQVAAQARMLREEREVVKGIDTILASTELEAGPRLTLAGTFREIHEQRRRGRKPTENGHRMLASWVARRTGQTPGTVNSHLKKLDDRHLIERRIVNETVPEHVIDSDGVKTTEEVQRKIGYVKTEPSAIITNILDYQRPTDAEKHGGKRDSLPHCPEHPHAGTITHTIVECAEPGCGAVVDRKRAVQTAADIFGPTTQDAHFDDLAASGTDGIGKMQSPKETVSDSNTQDAYSGSPPLYRAPVDLRQQFAAGGWD